jgi:hypothetical protein
LYGAVEVVTCSDDFLKKLNILIVNIVIVVNASPVIIIFFVVAILFGGRYSLTANGLRLGVVVDF